VTEVHVQLQEWQRIGPGTTVAVDGLNGFAFDSADDRACAERLSESGTLVLVERRDGLQIQARAHVGRLRLGRLTVTVTPKLGSAELLQLFQYAYGLRDVQRLGAAAYSTTGGLLQDLLIAQLNAEVRVLLERGVSRRYVPVDERLTSPRGQIDFRRLAQLGAQPDAGLPCRHHPRDTDHPLNRAVLAGLSLARRRAEDPRLALDVARLERAFGELANAQDLSAQLILEAERNLNRLVAPYASILRLIALLYGSQFLELEGEAKGEPLPGFLFDMNRFFQALILRFLEEHLPRTLAVQSERGLSGMMRYLPAENPRAAKAPTPRPDYAIRSGDQVVALLDAKYRDLWERSLPRDMLYQLSIYALSQPRGSTAAILYPTTDPSARQSRIEIRDPVSSTSEGFVAVRPVVLPHLLACLDDEGSGRAGARSELAARLAMGDTG